MRVLMVPRVGPALPAWAAAISTAVHDGGGGEGAVSPFAHDRGEGERVGLRGDQHFATATGC
jgi:hypothetical protein